MRSYRGIDTRVKDRRIRQGLEEVNAYLREVSASLAGVSPTMAGESDSIPDTARFLVLELTSNLSKERKAVVTSPLSATDGGANANWTVSLDNAAPSLVFGTTNVAGGATTAPLRVDATLALFDATLPEPIGTAATGVAAKAARRDHVHALTLGAVNFAVPANRYAVTPLDGVATTAVRTDATLPAPQLLKSIIETGSTIAGDTLRFKSPGGGFLTMTPNRAVIRWACGLSPEATETRALGTTILRWSTVAGGIGNYNTLTVNGPGASTFADDVNVNGTFATDTINATNIQVATLSVKDTGGSILLELRSDSTPNLTTTRILTINVADVDRTITFSGNPTLGDWFNQAVKTTSDVTHGSIFANLHTSADGSATAPAFAFSSDLDVGLWRPGGNTLGLAAGGASRIEMSTASLYPTTNGGMDLGRNGNGFGAVWLKDTAAAFETKLVATSAGISADNTLTFNLGNASRTLPCAFLAAIDQDLSVGGTPEHARLGVGGNAHATAKLEVNDVIAAPSTSIGVGIVNFYGTAATNFLGDPNAWLRVSVGGTLYKLPLYS